MIIRIRCLGYTPSRCFFPFIFSSTFVSFPFSIHFFHQFLQLAHRSCRFNDVTLSCLRPNKGDLLSSEISFFFTLFDFHPLSFKCSLPKVGVPTFHQKGRSFEEKGTRGFECGCPFSFFILPSPFTFLFFSLL